MTHEEQQATMRRKFACAVALGEMTYRQLCEPSSKALAKDSTISAYWAGGALRNEQRRRHR